MRFVLIMLLATTATCQETDVAMGAKIFHSHCAECHGLKGEAGRGPNLTTGQFYHGSTDADLMRNISDGIPGTAMPGVFFSPIQVSQLIAYIRETGEFLAGTSFAKQTWTDGLDQKGHPIRRPGMEPTEDGTYVWPSVQGATNWYSRSYNPLTSLYYLRVWENKGIYHKG
jgi:hypothetical protein